MMRIPKWAALLFALVAVSWAQEKHGSIQVQKYTIDAEVNPRTQSVVATAKIEFTPLDNTNDVTFELNNALTISKATDSAGKPLTTCGLFECSREESAYADFAYL